MTLPNPKWFPDISDTLDNAAAVDKGGGEVGLPITGHSFVTNLHVTISGTTNYDGTWKINSETADEIVITATYVAETFVGTETVISARQKITKEDLNELQNYILQQQQARLTPPLVRVDNATVRIEATADCPAQTMFVGIPNILNPENCTSGDLSDTKRRSVTTNVSMNFAAGDLWGAEKASQFYAILAKADNTDTGFVLKAMPWIRVKAQVGQTINFGTNLNASVSIGYGFTADEFVGGKIYFMTGASKGLMRTITANSNGATVPGTVTYSGDALSLSQGDWFIILPPTNFRWIGDVFNSASSNIDSIIHNLIFGLPYYTWQTAGTYDWVCPFTWGDPGWYSALADGAGGGGNGGSGTPGVNGGGGGGGSEQVKDYLLSLTAGTVYTITIGAAAAATSLGAVLVLSAGANGGNPTGGAAGGTGGNAGADGDTGATGNGGDGGGGIWGHGGPGAVGSTATSGKNGGGFGAGGGGGLGGAITPGNGTAGFLTVKRLID